MPARELINRRLIRTIIGRGYPMGQFEGSREAAIDGADLGFGFIYYALVRVLKPAQVVVVGSYRGFSVACTALGLVHNRRGRLHFIDAAVVDDFWTDPARVRRHFRAMGVGSRVTMHQMTTQRWLQTDTRARRGRPFIDLLLLDGDHTRRGAAFDYRHLGPLVKEGGYICLHDSFVGGHGKTEWEVADFLSSLDLDLYEAVTFEVAQGLTVIKRLPRTFIPGARLASRKRLRADLDRWTHAHNGDGRAGRPATPRLVRRILTDSVHLDRTLEMRNRFLAKSNHDLRRRNRTMRAELERLRRQVGG
jgi:predicted O-methyltransferase YrrM